jgi:endoglucanase
MKTRDKIFLLFFSILLIIFLIFNNGCDSSNDDDEIIFHRGDTPLEPYEQARALGEGVNFGNLMDAYPGEGSWTNGLVIKESHFDLAKRAGFDSVRIPIRFSAYASFNGPDYTIDESFMERVDQVVAWGLLKGLRVIVDMHHYKNDEFASNDPNQNDINKYPDENRDRFIVMWKQIASRYTNYPGELYYELLNEPNTNLTMEVWNSILADCIHAIREVDDYHTIIVGCANWSNYSGLDGLELPDDETNAIVTFHYYTPNLFLMQGQEWAGDDYKTTGIIWPGPPPSPLAPAPGLSQWVINWINWYNSDPVETNPCGYAIILDEIQTACDWGIKNNRPLWMSEFTAQDGGDMASRARWTQFVREELEKRNIPWSTWTLLSDFHSYIYDINSDQWVIELTDALGLNVSN